MNIGVRVGDQYEWSRNGGILHVTAVRGRKVKFEVIGATPIYGSMCMKEFLHVFKGKQIPRQKAA